VKHSYLLVGFLAAIALTIGAGVLHGRMTNRWGPPGPMVQAGAMLEKVPAEFGKWRLHSSGSLSEVEKNMLECTGELVRTYVDDETREAVSVTMIVGPPIPISQHTPEVCFSSREYRRMEARKPLNVKSGGSDHEFSTITFRSTRLEGGLIRVCWGWTADGRWSSSLGSRFAIARNPYLYKIQVMSPRRPPSPSGESDPCERFLSDFVPVVAQSLLTPSEH